MDLVPGTRLGIYEVHSLLGVGGMGEVYRARDTRLERDVAIKILPRVFTSDPSRLGRFEREARVLASLNHPNIAGIHGVEESDDVRGLVLELVEGETLADRIARRPALPLAESMAIARQIADALDATHEKGITHRDLKPANVKITPDGVVKVLDFGLATPPADSVATDGSTATWHHTREGAVVGTAAYMSPEQARGQSVDKRTDVWAFGCVLYEMLAGRPAFRGPTISDTVVAILDREPAWDALPASTPPNIRRLLGRLLEKDQRRRLRDIGDALVEFDSARSDSGPSAGPDPVVSRSAWTSLWVPAAALVAIGLVVAGWWLRRPAESRPLPETRLEIVTPPTNAPGSLAISPDGTQVTFVAESQGQAVLWLRGLSAVSARPLEGTEGASLPFWAPDSQTIGFFANGKLKQVDVEGGGTRTLADAANPQGGTWGADDTIVFSPHQISPLLRLSLRGGQTSEATRLAGGHVGHVFPQFLPDGVRLLFFVSGAPDVRGVYVGGLDGTDPRKLLDLGVPAVYVGSGHLLFVQENALFAQGFNAADLAVTGSPARVADPVLEGREFNGPVGAPPMSGSNTGSIVYRAASSGTGRQLTWFDRSGKMLGRVGGIDSGRQGPLSMAPDGRRLALSRVADGNGDVWVSDLERDGVMSRLTFDAANDQMPLWSRDGTRVVFGTSRNGPLDIYQRSLGRPTDEPLLTSPQNKLPMDWSPDGSVLLYVLADPKTHLDIWALPVGRDEKPFPLVQSPLEDLNPQFSPDGTWIAYHSDQSRRFEVYLQPFRGAGAPVPVSTGGGSQPRWRRDGKELFYLAPDRRLMAVPIAFSGGGRAVEAGAPVPLFQSSLSGQGLGQRQFEVSPDGQRFLIDAPIEGTLAPIVLIQNWKP